MSWPRLKIRRTLAISAFLIALILVILITFDSRFLRVASPLRPADAIVVLGGEPVVRVKAAAELFNNGFAPRVFISGSGDCEENRLLIQKLGVRTTNALHLECASQTTEENARFTIPLLREHGCKRVIIVTSWYHSRRAFNTFRRYAPEIQFMSAPVPRTQAWRYERNYVIAEYAKTFWYFLRFGICPVTLG